MPLENRVVLLMHLLLRWSNHFPSICGCRACGPPSTCVHPRGAGIWAWPASSTINIASWLLGTRAGPGCGWLAGLSVQREVSIKIHHSII